MLPIIQNDSEIDNEKERFKMVEDTIKVKEALEKAKSKRL